MVQSMDLLSTLNQVVSNVPQVSIDELAPGYPVICVANDAATATIALHGAHLIDFTPEGESPVIFTSRNAVFRGGKAIRGGIPVCWPWFSAHPSDSTLPSHGIARTSFWELIEVAHTTTGTRVVLSLTTDGSDPRWPFASTATIAFTIGSSLDIKLTTENQSDSAIAFSDTLHCYFKVGAADQSEVTGLDGATYVFNLKDDELKTQDSAIIIDQPIDRVYHSAGANTIVDRANHRVIHINKSGSTNTVVWNPGSDGAKDIGDLADDEFHQFVCVEAGNAHPSPITLEPAASHTTAISVTIGELSDWRI